MPKQIDRVNQAPGYTDRATQFIDRAVTPVLPLVAFLLAKISRWYLINKWWSQIACGSCKDISTASMVANLFGEYSNQPEIDNGLHNKPEQL